MQQLTQPTAPSLPQTEGPHSTGDAIDMPTATPSPSHISFAVAGGAAAELGGVGGVTGVAGVTEHQLGLMAGIGIQANVLSSGEAGSDPLGLGVTKSSLDFGDSDSEMTDGQSIQTPGKPKRIRV